jgi:sigma-E factor negative regulatory protein RseC
LNTYQKAKIIAVSDEYITVEKFDERQGCDSCESKSSCGTQLLSDWLSEKQNKLDLPKSFLQNPTVGSIISIAIPDNYLMKLSLIAYTLPLLISIVSAWFGSQYNEALSAVLFFIGLYIGVLLSKNITLKIENRYLKFINIVPILNQ